MFILRRSSSDPVLLKPSQTVFIDQWNGKNYSRNSSTSSYTFSFLSGQPVDELLLKFSDLEFAQIPKDISRRERMKLERKVQRNVRRRHSILVANKCQVQEPLGRFRSLSDLSSARMSSPTKRVSFSIEESHCDFYDSEETVDVLSVSRKYRIKDCCRSKLKPILVKRDRAQSLPLEHMDVVMFDAFKRGSKVSMEVQLDFLRSHRRKANRKGTATKNWGNPADMLKSFVLQCLSSRRNRTSPSEILCPFTAVESHQRAVVF